MQIPADAATKSPFLSISTDASAKKTTQSNVLPQWRQAKAHFLCRDGTHVDVQGAFSAIAANRRAEGRKGRRAEGNIVFLQTTYNRTDRMSFRKGPAYSPEPVVTARPSGTGR
jgi:hypothetical protein